MSIITIKTDNKWRDLLGWYDLTDKEKRDFDWLRDTEAAQFVRYKGRVYCLNEFMIRGDQGDFAKWDGLYNDSAFSGVLIKVSKDGERAKMGWYMC